MIQVIQVIQVIQIPGVDSFDLWVHITAVRLLCTLRGCGGRLLLQQCRAAAVVTPGATVSHHHQVSV